MPDFFIIAGCNGAGKTTASFTILPEILNCREFVNADEIARGLSPFQPEKVAFDAGRIMLQRMSYLFERGETFAIETTLATNTYKQKITAAQQQGYTVTLLFFWLNNVALAKERVKTRVLEGGHNIEPAVIERRYPEGIRHLFASYLPLVDEALIFDNSEGEHVLLAEKFNGNLRVIHEQKFNQLQQQYENGI